MDFMHKTQQIHNINNQPANANIIYHVASSRQIIMYCAPFTIYLNLKCLRVNGVNMAQYFTTHTIE